MGIGAPKCASTWLHDCLAEHSDVFVPDFKEVNFFARTSPDDIQDSSARREFEALYRGTEEFDARGSVSSQSMQAFMVRNAAQNMASVVPDVRLICLVRDPVERAHSEYWEIEGKSGLDYEFEDLVEGRAGRSGETILRTGNFAKQIQIYLEYFSREQLEVFLLEDIKERPEKVFEEICEFIGVDEAIRPDALRSRSNPASVKRSRLLHLIKRWAADVFEILRLSDHLTLRKVIKRTGIPALVEQWNTQPIEKPEMTQSQRERLLDYYESDIRELETIIDRDLDHWLKM